MGVNVNGNEIKKVIFDSNVKSNFPKRKDGKNDRVSMVKGLEHGHKYYVTLTVFYSDWTEYETILTLEKLLENRTYVQVRDNDRFGTFVLKFDTLLKDELKKGEFVQELQVQSDKYFKLINEMNEKIAKANKETDEQKNIVKFFKGKCENQLMIIEQQKNEITVVSKFKNNFNKLGRLFFRVLLRKAITMYNSGKTIDEVVDYVMEKFNDELNK